LSILISNLFGSCDLVLFEGSGNYLCQMMKHKLLIALCLFIFAVPLNAQKRIKPVPIIFDSDMGPDYDDVGAIAILHAYADSGYARILATVASTKYEGVAAVFSVFNTYFKRPAIPIGVPKGNASELKDFQHWTDSLLVVYPHKIKRNDEVQSSTEVYRKALSSQPDKSVVIVTTGFLTNLADLLQSPADKYSKLDGRELVRRKVKQLVCMGGRFPSGSEFNIRIDASASRVVAENWPTSILFSGVEIGLRIRSGLPLIHNKSIRNSPVKDVFRICIPMKPEDSAGRMSWDETAVLVAIKGYTPWYTIESGRIIVNSDGSNSWARDGSSHNYLTEALSPSVPEQLINKLIMHQPMRK
jgi:pyrimidine-specific ribonucleoside hydrolase